MTREAYIDRKSDFWNERILSLYNLFPILYEKGSITSQAQCFVVKFRIYFNYTHSRIINNIFPFSNITIKLRQLFF